MFAVTAGLGIEPLVAAFERDHDDYNSIMIKALADRLAEAFAEKLHELVRTDYWGFAKGESLSDEEIIREKYRTNFKKYCDANRENNLERNKQYCQLNKERLNKLRTTNRHKALEKQLQKSKDEETLGKC